MSSSPLSVMPRSAGLSVFLHLLALGTILFLAWWTQQVEKESPAIFELVAGAGDNYAATQAPTTTQPVPEKVDVDLPEPLPVVPRPQPPQPKPPPPKPIERKPEPPALKIEKAPEKPPLKIEPAREKVTFDQFKTAHGAPKTQKVRQPKPIQAKSINVDRIMASTSIITAGAGGTALTANEVSLSQRYVAMIIQRIRQSLAEAGIMDIREAGVQFSVSRQGAISGAKITQSSGSRDFDRAVMAAFRNIRPIGPTPTGRAEVFKTVIRLSEG